MDEWNQHLDDEESVTLQALASFREGGLDQRIATARLGYVFLVDTLVKKGYVRRDGPWCMLTVNGGAELARLTALGVLPLMGRTQGNTG
jgi:hypothetical protein